jgi:hypothetical protein
VQQLVQYGQARQTRAQPETRRHRIRRQNSLLETKERGRQRSRATLLQPGFPQLLQVSPRCPKTRSGHPASHPVRGQKLLLLLLPVVQLEPQQQRARELRLLRLAQQLQEPLVLQEQQKMPQ